MKHEGALALFSGGQDSTTCLVWALERYEKVETIGFDYGQRHRAELAQRPIIRENIIRMRPSWRARLGEDHIVPLEGLARISETALTRARAIEMTDQGLPNTFVPGRNLLFLTFAAALAYRRGLRTIIGGMCETDFSGYPDCRDDAVKAMQVALNVGMETRFVLETPLMRLNKAESWELAHRLGGDAFVNLIVEDSHTCYLGDRSQKRAWGYGCGECPACLLRAQGFEKWRAEAAKNIFRPD